MKFALQSSEILLVNSSFRSDAEAQLEIFDQPTLGMLSVFILASIVGFIGNCIILAVIIGSKKFRIKSNYLIGNLSIASVFYIVFGAFAAVYRNLFLEWPYGLRGCQLYLFFQRLPVAIFSFTTIAICNDRNHSVVNPLRPQRRTSLFFLQIFTIWMTSAAITIPIGLAGSVAETMSSSVQNPSKAVHCIESWTNSTHRMVYSIFLFLIVHLIPILIMLFGMFKIRSKMRFLLKSQNLFSKGSDRRVRLMRNNCIFFSIFIICWLPTGIFRLPLDLPKYLLPQQLVSDLLYYNDLCATMGYVITCIIPLILFAISHDLRDYLGNWSCFKENRLPIPEIIPLPLPLVSQN